MERHTCKSHLQILKNLWHDIKHGYPYLHNVYLWPRLMDEKRRQFFRYVGQVIEIEEGERVLEIGANKPLWQEYSNNVGSTGLFVSLDLYPIIQHRSKKELLETSQSMGKDFPEQLITADAKQIPFESNTFTLVMAHNYNGDLSPMLRETLRILAPRGKMCFSFISGIGIREIAMEQVSNECRLLGFDVGDISLYQNPQDKKDRVWFFIATKPQQKKL